MIAYGPYDDGNQSNARLMLSIATAKATPIFRQWRMSAGTCSRIQSECRAFWLIQSGCA